MEDKILEKSLELFLNFGFKSVTIDEITNSIGISKKTLYKYFSNKTQLVKSVTNRVFKDISCGIDEICALEMNPIDELFFIKKFVMEHLKDEKSSPQYQLQKYYPRIFLSLKQKQFEVMQGCVINNLKNGVALGLYRNNLNYEFISRIYFNGVNSIKDKDIFPLENYSIVTLMNLYLEYHLRGICTPKGLKQLENQLKINQ